MKKLFLAIAACCTLLSAHAADIFLGPKVGINFSTLRITNANANQQTIFSTNKRWATGYTAGGNFLFRFNNYVALQTEINSTMKALRYVNGNNYTMTRLMQVEFPVMVKVGYGKENYMVYADFGPYFTGNTRGKLIVRNNETKVKSTLDFSGWNHYDIGLGFGFGGMYIMKRGALDAEFRYNLGLVKQKITPADPNVKWNTMQLTLAYVFKVKENHRVEREK